MYHCPKLVWDEDVKGYVITGMPSRENVEQHTALLKRILATVERLDRRLTDLTYVPPADAETAGYDATAAHWIAVRDDALAK